MSGLDVVDEITVEVVGLDPHDVLWPRMQALRNPQRRLPEDRVPGKQEIQDRNPWRGQRHPHQPGLGQANIVREAGRPGREVDPCPGARTLEPKLQDPVADRFGDEQVRLVRRQHDAVGEGEVPAQHRDLSAGTDAHQTSRRRMGDDVLSERIPCGGVRRGREIDRPVRADDRIAAEMEGLAVDLAEQHVDLPGRHVETEQPLIVIAHEQVPVRIRFDAERPAAGVAEHDAPVRADPHHVAIGQAGDGGSSPVDQHILAA